MCFGRTDMAYFQVKRTDDGRGPYRWAHVVKSPNGDFRQGSIYRQLGDNLDNEDALNLAQLCVREGFDLRCVRRGQSV